jgi:hypothetical protein
LYPQRVQQNQEKVNFLSSESRGVHQYSQQAPTPSPPIEIAQFLGFSRFHFLQRPLCKVDPELCTEKGIPKATALGYALATVDKFWIRAVDNWSVAEKPGGIRERNERKGWRVHFRGTCTTIANPNHHAKPIAFTNKYFYKNPEPNHQSMPRQGL